jgi:hypothetical protein
MSWNPVHIDFLSQFAERNGFAVANEAKLSLTNQLNWPKRADNTLSPGESVLANATSQPAVPVAGKMKDC